MAALQLDTQALSNARLEYYIRLCKQKNVDLIVIGEYVLNSFFTELKNMPSVLIKEQSKVKIAAIKEYSRIYNICIVAPVIIENKIGFKKTCLIANDGRIKYYDQQVLMPYSHWNEEEFFKNKKSKIKLNSFKLNGLKIGILFGYEIHFDEFFSKAYDLDLLLVPTANTYNSNMRWIDIIKTRAFLKNINILRVNRIGISKVDELEWSFYGNSFLCNDYGEIIQELSENEEVLICDIEKSNKASKFWKFKEVSIGIEKRIL